jgi:hypothetical protein
MAGHRLLSTVDRKEGRDTMSRKQAPGTALLVAVASLMVAVLMVAACGRSLVPVTGELPATDLNLIPICLTADGAGDGQTYPCVWEEAHEDAQPYPGIRWVWYVDESCDRLTALPAQRDQGVKCIDVREWSTPAS